MVVHPLEGARRKPRVPSRKDLALLDVRQRDRCVPSPPSEVDHADDSGHTTTGSVGTESWSTSVSALRPMTSWAEALDEIFPEMDGDLDPLLDGDYAWASDEAVGLDLDAIDDTWAQTIDTHLCSQQP
eukprot:scaffold10_cov257-Pinguiococcus_pyrenoidosus.AAC.72